MEREQHALLHGGAVTLRARRVSDADGSEEVRGMILPANENAALPLDPGKEALAPKARSPFARHVKAALSMAASHMAWALFRFAIYCQTWLKETSTVQMLLHFHRSRTR
jgi:hypothetical protein